MSYPKAALRPNSFLCSFLICAVMLLCGSVGRLYAQSLRVPGSTAVGGTALPLTVPVVLGTAGTIDSVRVRTQGSDGLDFADAGGGTCARGQTYLAGQQCTVVVQFTPTSPGSWAGAVVLLDSQSAVLGMQRVTGAATGSVTVFIPGKMDTLAGDATWIYAGDGGPANQSNIFLPFGVTVDGAGNVILADSSNSRVRRVDAVTGLISTVAGNGVLGSKGDGGAAVAANLSNPTAVALDGAGNLYITDSGNNVVRRVSAFEGTIRTVAGTINSHGYAGYGGQATAALLNGPNGLAFDADGNLYLADTGNNVIRMVSALTGVITTVAGSVQPGFSGDGGPALAARLNGPWSVTLDAAGGYYIADQNNHVIRQVSSAGLIQTIVGTGSAGFSGDGYQASLAQLNVPASVALDTAGNLYIADSGNNRVRKVNAGDGTISTVAGNTSESFTGDGGSATVASLYGPYALALDGQGNLLIADVFHNRVRKLSNNQISLQFPPIRVNRVTPPQLTHVENDGNAPMQVAGLLAITNAQLDPLTDCAAPSVLAVLQKCQIAVDFAPKQTGAQVVGEVDVKSDAANSPGAIILSGQVLDVDPTRLILSSSANPAATGSTINFQISASSDGSTPTGSVSLLDGTSTIGSTPLQPGGMASFSISSLTAGTHNMTATYGGDSGNTSAVSAVLAQVVQDPVADTMTSLVSSANPVDAGAVLTLTAAVGEKVQGAGTGAVTGVVVFTDGVNQLGSANVMNGAATLAVSNLTVGTYGITASYKGVSNYGPSSSAQLSQVVRLATTKSVLTTSGSPASAGAAVTLTVSVLSSGAQATGAVSFSDGGVALGKAMLNAQGIATLVVPGTHWGVGTHPLAASYAGDASNQGSNTAVLNQVIQQAATQVSVGSTLNPSGQGAAVTFGVSVRGNGGVAGGTVQILDGGAVIGSVTLDATAAAYFTTSALTVGSHAITATYGGDADDASSTSSTLTEVVQPATTAIAFSTSANPAAYGAPMSLLAVVSGSGSVATGSVTFMDGSVVLGSAAVDASGSASLSGFSLAIGPHSLSALYNGDKVHGALASSAISERIVQSTATALTLLPSHTVAGLPVVGSVTVTGANSKSLTGAVTVMEGAAVLITLTPDATGSASFQLPMLAPGSHTLIASYVGDSNDLASVSAAQVEVIDVAVTTTVLHSSANPVGSGTALTLTAMVTGNGGEPKGNVSLLDGGSTIASAPVVNGAVSFTLATLAPGIHQLSAAYAGDLNDRASVSAAVSEQVALQTTVTLGSNANPTLLSDDATLTITVANGAAGAPSGTVTVTDGGALLATLTLDAGGHASYHWSAPALGSHTLVASYAGDPRNAPATSQPLVQAVVLRPTTNSFTASVTQISAGQQIVLISVVQGSGPRVPTGRVNFRSGSTLLGSATVNVAGLATVTVKPQEGLYNVVSTYAGDALYAASSSQAIAITVGPPIEFTINLTPATVTLQSGGHAVVGISLDTAATFKDTLAFGCAGLPTAATCVFSENQIAVSSGGFKSFNVTVDTGSPLGSGPVAEVDGAGSGPVLCMLPAGALLALLLGRKRHRRPLGLLLALVTLGAVTALSGCGNSFSEASTAAGGYTFQIVGTGNTTGATQTATVVMTVTK